MLPLRRVIPPDDRLGEVGAVITVRWLLLRPWDDLRPEEQVYRTHLPDNCPDIRAACQLADDFAQAIRNPVRQRLSCDHVPGA